MWDALRHSYRFRCPAGDSERGPVPLSAFRSVERLSGPAHPAVFQVVHECAVCGGEHAALAPHDELDHAPLAATVEVSFWNPMTGSRRGRSRARALAGSRRPASQGAVAVVVLVLGRAAPAARLPIVAALRREARLARRRRRHLRIVR